MAGRHRKRPGLHVQVPQQRAPCRPGIELVDAQTRIMHRVAGDELLAGRRAGRYQALCGARLLGASLTEPGRGRCAECAQ
jgi:hypothetical protein